MSENIKQFGIYTAKIFDVLYDSFPIPTNISRNEIIAEYLLFDRDDELRELKTKKDFADLFTLINTENSDLKEKAINALPKIKDQLNSLEIEKRQDSNKQIEIYEGTIDFLICEGLIRESNNGGYQLTSKSFTHLNKTFKDASITDKESSFITALKAVFQKSSSTSIDIAASTAINILTKLLGDS